MTGTALDRHGVPQLRSNACHSPDREISGFQYGTLLNMRFKVGQSGPVASRLIAIPREAIATEGIRQSNPLGVADIEHAGSERSRHGPTRQHRGREAGSLFITKCVDLDRKGHPPALTVKRGDAFHTKKDA
jgi:hypothetical protein